MRVHKHPGRSGSGASNDAGRGVEVTNDLAAAYLDMVDEFEATGEGYGFNDTDLAHQDYRRKSQPGPPVSSRSTGAS